MAENLHTKEDLRQRQALPLEAKISMTRLRIRQWYNYFCGDVCVSFSGGKDSTVLLHLVRDMYPDVKAIFVNTGLEYPEIQSFVKTFDNVEIVRPAMRFDEVISKYGYPLISKEVAEAIYYARRIRSQTSTDRQTDRQTDRRTNVRNVSSTKQVATTAYKRDELENKRTQNDTKCRGGVLASTAELVQLSERNETETRTQRIQSRGKWYNYHRRTLNPDFTSEDDLRTFGNLKRNTDYHDWRRGCL